MEGLTPMEIGDDAFPSISGIQDLLSMPLLDGAPSFAPKTKAEVNEDDDEKENFGLLEQSLNSECLNDSNFAIICSFIDQFGTLLGLDELPFDELQLMMENTEFVAVPLLKLHIVLLRPMFKHMVTEKWEQSLAKFCHSYCAKDGQEIERFGYNAAKLATKLRLLKNLLEAQFDCNFKFKAKVNKLDADNLRLTPLGQDRDRNLYWYQMDGAANLRVYRENLDDESWEIAAQTRKELSELISKLQQESSDSSVNDEHTGDSSKTEGGLDNNVTEIPETSSGTIIVGEAKEQSPIFIFGSRTEVQGEKSGEFQY